MSFPFCFCIVSSRWHEIRGFQASLHGIRGHCFGYVVQLLTKDMLHVTSAPNCLSRTLDLRGRMLCVAMQSSYSSGRMDCFACLWYAHFPSASRQAMRDLHLSCQLLFLLARQIYAVALWLRFCGTGPKSGDSQMRLDLGSTCRLNPVVLVR